MEDWQKNRIESAKNDTNPMLMIETNGGYAVLEIHNFYLDIAFYYLKRMYFL